MWMLGTPQPQDGAHECRQPPCRSRSPQHSRGAADGFACGRPPASADEILVPGHPAPGFHRRWSRCGDKPRHATQPLPPDQILEGAAPDKFRNYRNSLSTQPAGGFLAGMHVYLRTHPRRILAPDPLPRQQAGRRLYSGPRIPAEQARVLPPAQRLLPATPVHNWDGMC